MSETKSVTADKIPEPRPKAELPYPLADWTDIYHVNMLFERVLVRRVPPEEESPGGIVLPGSAQEIGAMGWVVKWGNRVPDALFHEGDNVIFPSHAIQDAPELGGRIDREKHWTEFVYINYQDLVAQVEIKFLRERDQVAQEIREFPEDSK